jgi:hypothetical protein
LAVTAVPTGIAEESLGSVRDRIMAQRHEALDLVVVVDRDQRYLGAADLRDVMVGDADTALLAIVKPAWPHVSPQTTRNTLPRPPPKPASAPSLSSPPMAGFTAAFRPLRSYQFFLASIMRICTVSPASCENVPTQFMH